MEERSNKPKRNRKERGEATEKRMSDSGDSSSFIYLFAEEDRWSRKESRKAVS
jgi:hypothetical protein